MQRIPSETIDLAIADPPFGIDFDGKSSVYNRDESLVVENYQEVSDSYDDFTNLWVKQVERVLKPNGSAYVFSGWTNLESVLRAAREVGLHTLNHIVWHYNFGVFTKRRFVTSHYHVLLLVKDPRNYFFNKIEHYPKDVWVVKREYRSGEAKNGTKLPLDVVARCIDYSSKPGDLILDPFMGNGTTAAACKANYRHFIGFEINQALRDIIELELESIRTGENYQPYGVRLPSVEQLATLYPRAYQEYLRLESISKETHDFDNGLMSERKGDEDE
ncbi:MAG: site-specific DNA-methyltransferase [Candidatus Thorarchaeota archaeon]|nr:site-specific DNA-methyltransferase [Candidatus Thorarchaeota archaeon]